MAEDWGIPPHPKAAITATNSNSSHLLQLPAELRWQILTTIADPGDWTAIHIHISKCAHGRWHRTFLPETSPKQFRILPSETTPTNPTSLANLTNPTNSLELILKYPPTDHEAPFCRSAQSVGARDRGLWQFCRQVYLEMRGYVSRPDMHMYSWRNADECREYFKELVDGACAAYVEEHGRRPPMGFRAGVQKREVQRVKVVYSTWTRKALPFNLKFVVLPVNVLERYRWKENEIDRLAWSWVSEGVVITIFTDASRFMAIDRTSLFRLRNASLRQVGLMCCHEMGHDALFFKAPSG